MDYLTGLDMIELMMAGSSIVLMIFILPAQYKIEVTIPLSTWFKSLTITLLCKYCINPFSS